MPKMLIGLILVLFYLESGIALAVDMKTAEKWTCVREGLTRVVRLYAPEKGQAPCKVFYFKRDPADPTDAQAEIDQAQGLDKPIYYSTSNGGFCVRKMDEFVHDRQVHQWTCQKQ
jgi:hypothetical protein